MFLSGGDSRVTLGPHSWGDCPPESVNTLPQGLVTELDSGVPSGKNHEYFCTEPSASLAVPANLTARPPVTLTPPVPPPILPLARRPPRPPATPPNPAPDRPPPPLTTNRTYTPPRATS